MTIRKNFLAKWFDKILVYGFIFLLFYFLYIYFEQDVLVFLKHNPWIADYYNYFYTEISSGSFIGIVYISFFATIFFLFIPIEGVILAYVVAGGEPLTIIGAYALGAFLGIAVNYWIGYFLGQWGLRKMLKEKHDVYETRIEKCGGFALFMSNLLPIIPEVVNAVYGGFRYPFFKYMVIAMAGKILKCGAIVFGKDFMLEYFEEMIRRL